QKKAVLIQKPPSTKGCVILPNLSDLSKFRRVNPLQLRLLKSVLSKTDREVQTRGRIGPGDWFCSPILTKPDSSRKSSPYSTSRQCSEEYVLYPTRLWPTGRQWF